MPPVARLRRARQSVRSTRSAMTVNAFAEDSARCLAAGKDDLLGERFNPDASFATLLESLECRPERALMAVRRQPI